MGISSLAGLGDVEVKLSAIVGRTEVTFEEAVNLDVKSRLSLDKTSSDPVDVCVNGKLVARGKLVVVEGNYGVQITELIKTA
jgi:flagellar motor switch protein FliN/FliY